MRELRRGFTLIELMIVIAIIATLAAILIPNFLHARAQAQTASCELNEKNIATAMEEYAVDNAGAYQSGTAGIGLTSPYLNGIPTDPVSGSLYTIATAGKKKHSDTATYEISDAGGHDTTTTKNLRTEKGAPCNNCDSIIYEQDIGLIGSK